MTTTPRDYDLMILGGGAAGLTAAREGHRRGARTLLVNDGPLGGDCTFTGCVPSKALLAAAAQGLGFDQAITRVRDAIDRIAAREDAPTLRAEGIDVAEGRGVLRSPTEVDVDGTRYRSRRVIVATGAAASIPPIPGLRETRYLTNENVFSLERRPASMVVLGGGAIGVELAQAFARLGTNVTIVEALERLLAREEPEASSVVRDALVDDGVDVRTGSRVTAISAPDGRVCVALDADAEVEAEQLLVAVGREPVSRGFGLEDIGVASDARGFIHTTDTLATTTAGVWAIGDVTGRLLFTHAAGRMAIIAVHNALSRTARLRPKRFDPSAIPWVTFTSPQIGRVGITEADAADIGGTRVAYLPLDELDRAVAEGTTRGFVKLIAGPRPLLRNLGGGRILGATIVAPTGGELVDEVALAMHLRAFTGRLAQAVHAYPTWSSGLQQTAAQFFFEYGGRVARPPRRG